MRYFFMKFFIVVIFNSTFLNDDVILKSDVIAGSGAGNLRKGGNKTVDDVLNGLKETTNGKGIARNFESSGDMNKLLRILML